jgi:16S rRNA (adenine1518-N6/adenine1519-N6)-dimethyltransferase
MNQEEIKQLMEQYGLRPIRDRGQNFLLDESVIELMVDEAEISSESNVLEVGPGLGPLTEVLLGRGARVCAVEFDPSLARVMRERFQTEKLTLIEGDFLSFSTTELINHLGTTSEGSYKIVANLPYSITSAAIKKILTESPRPQTATVMIQREVAQRIIAEPPNSSLLSIVVRTYGESKISTYVPRSAFWPQPKVDSAVLHISLYSSAEIPERIGGLEPEKFISVVRQAFSEPRKQIKNTLGNRYGTERVVTVAEAVGLSPQIRPERVHFREWVQLTSALMQ